ncbi:hypothetical protein [Streptomyces sp. NBC_01481]|uniref:hypothetical protein n=1 Tax=Streptomyces sp. NBC_01481 TaxID=2975869 RepID=UPI00225B3ECC|nr:hypothetical protein [Streptomyces sp. NBC_01481]MCX4582538.1 hypothetical protein [Streptomyces sp. NBC_01481]
MPVAKTGSRPLDSISANAARELSDALESIGVKLPSARGEGEVNGKAYVNLGGCAAEQAFALAHWIRDHQ